MDYSIVIPVFNKAGLTRNCLRTLPATLAGTGTGEVIVIDNASTDDTPEMLTEFPWASVVRNERNLGFAGANNQAARLASGEYLILLNNDTQGFPGWLLAMLRELRKPDVGIVGARLLYPNDTIQHAGVVVSGMLFGRASLAPFHYAWKVPATAAHVNVRREYQIVTGACLGTPRDLYLELGGLDEAYWNGYEDVDYCLRVRERGLKIVYEPEACLYHFESQSGAQRFRKTFWNIYLLSERWRGKVDFDAVERSVEYRNLPILYHDPDAAASGTIIVDTPPTTVLVHGTLASEERAAFEASLRAGSSPITAVRFCDEASAVAVAREEMLVRGERYLAFVDARAKLEPRWLDRLISHTAAPPNIVAATYAPELPPGSDISTLACDARCTLLRLNGLPQHWELREDFDTLGGALADFLLTALENGRGTCAVKTPLATVPPVGRDASFERVRGMPLRDVFDPSAAAVETVLRARKVPPRGLVSIVTLSWNAPQFTVKALESIRAHTSEPYEVIVVDNGSGEETLAALRAIDDPHVRVIYNRTNRGFGGGNNVGMAAALGGHVVVLNNDVVVTEGWLDGLLEPFRRIPTIGVTAPRSNKVVGHQQLPDALYEGEDGMVAFAARRRERFRESGYYADRAIGLCLCISRDVLEQVGGFDERFKFGNFEDDDYSIRVRAAGYGIFICNDVFIHHFGSQSFAANKVDYAATMTENWDRFAEKWGYPPAYPVNGYQPRRAIKQGFDPRLHRVPIASARASKATAQAGAMPPGIRLVFSAAVRADGDWTATAEFVKRFARAFKLEDGAMLAIAAFDVPVAATLGTRIERIFKKEGIDLAAAGYVDVGDEDDAALWLERFAGARVVDVASLRDRSPSALRRLVAEAAE